MSLGINLMMRLVRLRRGPRSEGFDVEILEKRPQPQARRPQRHRAYHVGDAAAEALPATRPNMSMNATVSVKSAAAKR